MSTIKNRVVLIRNKISGQSNNLLNTVMTRLKKRAILTEGGTITESDIESKSVWINTDINTIISILQSDAYTTIEWSVGHMP